LRDAQPAHNSGYRRPDPKVDAAWAAEIERRIDGIDSGREVSIPGGVTAAKIRQIVGL
jgi:hypothetical protein